MIDFYTQVQRFTVLSPSRRRLATSCAGGKGSAELKRHHLYFAVSAF